MPKFQPGQSGNPAGRRPGHRSKVAALLDAMAGQDAAEIYAELKRLAVGGDVAAAKLILDRCWPVPRGRRVGGLDLPPLRVADDARTALAEVVRAVAAGEITADEGRDIAGLVAAFARAAAGAAPPVAYADDALDFSGFSDSELRATIDALDRAAVAARRRRVGGDGDDSDGSNGLN